MLGKNQSHEHQDTKTPQFLTNQVAIKNITETEISGMALLSEESLRFFQDNLQLLNLSTHAYKQTNEKLEHVIDQSVKIENDGEDAYQDISFVNQVCLDAVKSATEAIIYLTGTPLLNRIAQHVSKQLIQGQLNEYHKDIFKNTIHIIDQLIQCPFAYLHCVDLQFLIDHVALLNLDANTEQNYRENLSVVVMERMAAIAVILKSARKLGANYINGNVL